MTAQYQVLNGTYLIPPTWTWGCFDSIPVGAMFCYDDPGNRGWSPYWHLKTSDRFDCLNCCACGQTFYGGSGTASAATPYYWFMP